MLGQVREVRITGGSKDGMMAKVFLQLYQIDTRLNSGAKQPHISRLEMLKFINTMYV